MKKEKAILFLLVMMTTIIGAYHQIHGTGKSIKLQTVVFLLDFLFFLF